MIEIEIHYGRRKMVEIFGMTEILDYLAADFIMTLSYTLLTKVI